MQDQQGANHTSDTAPAEVDTPPAISSEVQNLLDRQRHNRAAEEAIRQKIEQIVGDTVKAYPDQVKLLAAILEGFAQRLRSELEVKKKKERADAR